MKKNIFKRYSSNRNRPLDRQADEVTITRVEAAPATIQNLKPRQFLYGFAQSVGKHREHNEDSIFALSLAVGGQTGSLPLGLFIVADGMGGHQLGEVASSTAIRAMASFFLKQFQPSLIDVSSLDDEIMQNMLRSAINEAQRAVLKEAPGSGTTLTAAFVLGQQVMIAHVGDSRAYLIHQDGKGEVLTHDHSLVKRMEELGQISSEEAAVHPRRNVLYRALGQGDILEPDIFSVPFPMTDYLLLCSDGLWGVILENQLFQLVSSSQNLQTACQNLVTAANNAGGPDNISVIVIKSAA